jgi:hypothetical protein
MNAMTHSILLRGAFLTGREGERGSWVRVRVHPIGLHLARIEDFVQLDKLMLPDALFDL